MKILTAILFAVVLMSLTSCSPSGEEPPPVAEPSPTASAEGAITEMDFESGEVEAESEETVEGDETPDDPGGAG